MSQEEAIRFAVKFLEDIVSFFGMNVAVKSSIEDEVIELSVPSSENNAFLIGRNAETLRSLQQVVSLALAAQDAEVTRVNIDVAGYKKQRASKVEERAEKWIQKVLDTGRSMTVELNAADRRVVHKLAENYLSIKTYSVGEGRERKLVIEKTE